MANEPLRPNPTLPQYRWAPAGRGGLGAYIDADGRTVSALIVRMELDAALDGISREAAELGQRYLDGELSEDEWYWAMIALIKSAHLIGAAAERGGWGMMTYADYGRVGRIVERERGFLDRFLEGLVAGTALLGGAFLLRSMLYMQAGRGTYYEFADETAASLSATGAPVFEQRVLDPGARHCPCCIEQAGMGTQPLGTLLPIGRCDCRANCRCVKIYVDAAGREIVQ